MTAISRWAIVLMDGSPSPVPHRAWYIEGAEETAEAFRAFVSAEIDPAVKIRLADATGELLTWRTSVAISEARALREIPLLPLEIARLTAELCKSQPTQIAADLGVKLALALDDWIARRTP